MNAKEIVIPGMTLHEIIRPLIPEQQHRALEEHMTLNVSVMPLTSEQILVRSVETNQFQLLDTPHVTDIMEKVYLSQHYRNVLDDVRHKVIAAFTGSDEYAEAFGRRISITFSDDGAVLEDEGMNQRRLEDFPANQCSGDRTAPVTEHEVVFSPESPRNYTLGWVLRKHVKAPHGNRLIWLLRAVLHGVVSDDMEVISPTLLHRVPAWVSPIAIFNDGLWAIHNGQWHQVFDIKQQKLIPVGINVDYRKSYLRDAIGTLCQYSDEQLQETMDRIDPVLYKVEGASSVEGDVLASLLNRIGVAYEKSNQGVLPIDKFVSSWSWNVEIEKTLDYLES